ncbi:MAG TPA: LPS export ABC transporter periplasmic protein LptC [Bacteroidales bacterium]|nr:LPS export ABC transporter periplasmic protein LptC [Bacteroidales bacterium]HOK75604.1 LPS export ABC transporter periplasmic protein LptC [Bacteroidales bacterium]HPP93565.1 LPS export ABC transporter periplasmic protein LptC [Bacteroidales bacterium]HRR16613.1 LPS export ABC transporter periplasmic protein LptC [Bacteroidales bacterium]HRT48488.1 LPS export ABC transporter periplasmic protein LptC [Bacteroidales bacterium]
MSVFKLRLSLSNFLTLTFRKNFFIVPVFLFFLSSCERKIETIPKSDIESLPSLIEKDFETIYTDSAKLQLVMRSPLMERYTDRKPQYTEFRKGITVIFYDGNPTPIASISSRYARYIEDKKLWELKDSVTAVNEKNETLETELLYWDQEKDIVYTDRFVRIKSEEQIVMGTGFEANSRFTRWKIRNVSATIYLRDEE